jgi:hypothetical protein
LGVLGTSAKHFKVVYSMLYSDIKPQVGPVAFGAIPAVYKSMTLHIVVQKY